MFGFGKALEVFPLSFQEGHLKFRSPKKISPGKSAKVKLLLAGQDSPTVSLKITEMEEGLEDFTGVGLVKERPKAIEKLTYQMALAGVEGACRRVSKRISVTIRLRSRQLPNYRGITANVNETGIEMHLDGPMPDGTPVSLEFDVPEMSDLQIQGVSIWTSQTQMLGKDVFRVGVEFNETDTRVLEAWSAFYRRILQTDGASVMMKSMGDGSESSLRESQRVAEARESGRHATVEGADRSQASFPATNTQPPAQAPSQPPFQPPAPTTPSFQSPPSNAAPQFSPPSPPNFSSPVSPKPTPPNFAPPAAPAPPFTNPQAPPFQSPSAPPFGLGTGSPPPFGQTTQGNPPQNFSAPASPHSKIPRKLGLPPKPTEHQKPPMFPAPGQGSAPSFSPPQTSGTPSFAPRQQNFTPPPLNLPPAGPPSFQPPPPPTQPFQPPQPSSFSPPAAPQHSFQPPPPPPSQAPERVTTLKIQGANIMFRCRMGDRYQVGGKVKVELAFQIQGQQKTVAVTTSISGAQREADGSYTCVGFILEDQQRIEILNQLLG